MKYLGIKIFLLFFLANSYAVTIKDVSFSKSKENGTLKIFYNGIMRSNPEMTIRDKEIFISIPKANLIKSIDKKENFSTNNQQDTQIKVKKKEHSTDVSLVLPFNIEQKHERVSMLINDKYLKVTLPRVSVKNVEKPVVINKVVEPKKEEKVVNTKPVEEVLGEGYLNKLIAEKKSEEKKVFNKTEKDVVKTTQASTEKSKFSLLGYAGKFVAFLGFVLLFFYGIVLVFKKGVFSKGKLGFLNNTNQITVLSTSHIAPKKSLMMVKVHKQIFLLSSTENGISFLSEITDPTGLIKNGEAQISGSNFDSKLVEMNTSEDLEERIVLKNDISKSQPLENSLQKKFRQEIKNKIKNLKPMQQA